MNRPLRHRFLTFTLAGLCCAAPFQRAGAQTPGSIDSSFNPSANANDTPLALAVQGDRKILIAGSLTEVNGQPRSRIGRLDPNGNAETAEPFDASAVATNSKIQCLAVQQDGKIVVGGDFMVVRRMPNGTLDESFHPAQQITETGGSVVNCLAIQPDGKILVGGRFTSIGGETRHGLVRLMPDGLVDLSFNPDAGVGGLTPEVRTLALQDDGKIVIGGTFETVNGQPRTNIARLLPGGSVEGTAAFNASISGTTSLSGPYAILQQPDGKLLIGGNFTAVNGAACSNFVRLLPNGTRDPAPVLSGGLIPGPSGRVESMALQADGKVLLTGFFPMVNGQSRKNFARLLPDQSLDPQFVVTPDALPGVHCTALQADGKVLFTGGGTIIDGEFHARIYRFANSPAAQSLTKPAINRLVWMRSGAVPEVSRVTIETSTDSGTIWTDRGAATRIPGGWEWTGATLPAQVMVRVRGITRGGYRCGSSGVVEIVTEFNKTPVPVLGVEQPPGTSIGSGSQVNFGNIAFGAVATRDFILRNSGDGNLSGLNVTIDGPDAALFEVTPALPEELTLDGTAAFTVRFSASATGPRTAGLHIFSNDPVRTRWDLTLTGTSSGTATEIAVEHPPGVNFTDGASVNFGLIPVDGSGSSLTWTIKNAGTADLIGLTPHINGPDAAYFSVTTTPVAPVSPGGSTSLTVRFSPSAPGNRTAVLHLLNNDPDESPFDIVLTGQGVAPAALGELDQTFGGMGFLPEFPQLSAGNCVAVQEDGRILVAGHIAGTGGITDFALWRFLPDGRPDTGFNSTGLVVRDFGDGPAIARSIAIQSDGKILVAGDANGDFALMRCLPDGSLDPAFNGTGTVTTDLGRGTGAIGYSMILLGDGRILMGGQGLSPGEDGSAHFALARYLTDGKLDTTFGSGGTLMAQTGSSSVCTGMVVLADGRILACGYSGTAGENSVFVTVRFTASGQPDATFGLGGAAQTDFGIFAVPRGIAVLPDGRILVAGSAVEDNDVPEQEDFALAWYHPNGSPDLTVGDGIGRLIVPSVSFHAVGHAMTMQADGKILIAGYRSLDNTGKMMRLLPDGSPDLAFHPEGVVSMPVHRAAGLAVQRDGKILVSGSSPAGRMQMQRFTGSSLPLPEILMQTPEGAWIPDHGVYDFGALILGRGKNARLTIKNAGYQNLEIQSITVEPGPDAALFITDGAPAVLLPGEIVSFNVTFTASTAGTKNAVLRITSNDPDAATYLVNLTGHDFTAGDTWDPLESTCRHASLSIL